MIFRLPEKSSNGSGRKWRHRRQQSGLPPSADSPVNMPELIAVPCSVALCSELSPDARRLYSAINRNEYVICIDPPSIAALVNLTEHNLQTCLNELRRAGMISTWIGNLVFFE